MFLVLLVCLSQTVPLTYDDPDLQQNSKPSTVDTPLPSKKVEDLQTTGGELAPAGNFPDNHYPVEKSISNFSIKESSDKVAAAPVVDPQNKTVFGVQPPPISFDRPEDRHPMEIATPLADPFPCDDERILNVEIPAATLEAGQSVATLPLRYGCTDEYEVSREKASPEVRWSNVSNDVQEFSLQLVSMGDSNCPGVGEGSGKILWHITGIKAAASVTLDEAASHDTRLLHGGHEQPNQWLEEYYSGPCPKPGVTECYRFKVLAHKSNGRCQCGFKDVLFTRPDKKEYQPWTYEEPKLAPVGTTKTE